MLYEEFNKLTNTLQEEPQSTVPHPWLAQDEKRRNLTNRYGENTVTWRSMTKPERKGRVY